MKLEQLFLLHLMVGVGVGVCVYLSASSRHVAARLFQTLAAVVFWPLFLPVLLSHRAGAAPGSTEPPAPNSLDEPDRAIAQVEEELKGALQSLDGWGMKIRESAQGRLLELRDAWTAQAGRIREMDQIITQSKDVLAAGHMMSRSESGRGSQDVIRQNMERLKLVRQQTLEDLLGKLTRVRELVSMIHLARFTGEPAARAEELVAQIGAVIQGISGTTGQPERKENGIISSIAAGEEARLRNRD